MTSPKVRTAWASFQKRYRRPEKGVDFNTLAV